MTSHQMVSLCVVVYFLMTVSSASSSAHELRARVVGGTAEVGRLEIFFNGAWNTVCRTGFGQREALVACRLLGFNSTNAAAVLSAKYGEGSGPILFSKIQCVGYETSLAQCQHPGLHRHDCGHRDDVGVVCNMTQELRARVVGGTAKAGRLEIFYDGVWNTVCGHGFGQKEALVACRMLGFNSTTAVPVGSDKYGEGSGPILFSNLQCVGNETSLAQCQYPGLYTRCCGHRVDVGVACNITQELRARVVGGTAEAGRLEIFYYGYWNTVCRNGFGQREALVACRMLGFNSTTAVAVGSVKYGEGSGPILFSNLQCVGNETSLAQCKHPGLYRYDCYHSEDVGVACNIKLRARVVGGTAEAGRLEIFYDGDWNTVCQEKFGHEEALVACRMLGFNSTTAAVMWSDKYGAGSGPILFSNLRCVGNETSLAQCKHPGLYIHDCEHRQDVGVVCNMTLELRARVVAGTAEAGRLEIFYDGAWNTVCQDGFGRKEALVACRMLGFNSTTAVPVGSAKYGKGSGPILFSNLQCVGNETSLAQCKHPGLYRHKCGHRQDVGVVCNMALQLRARVVDGTAQAGRLEIFYDGAWNTVCFKKFGHEEALVACRMLGIKSTTAVPVGSVKYGEGSGPILFSNLRCVGNETSLAQCKHPGLYRHNCGHWHDVGVVCKRALHLRARVVGGTAQAGRLEIFYDGAWNTVCFNKFGHEEALVACRMLGINSTTAVPVGSAKYGKGSGRILFSNLQCVGNETSLAQCKNLGLYRHNCGHMQHVGVVCNMAHPLGARVVGGTAEEGRLEIFYDGTWNTVCQDGFGQKEAFVACRMLGFNSTTAAAVGSAKYGAGSGPILFSNLQCVGNETSLAQCKYPGLYRHKCKHANDVGVLCNMTQELRARVVGGTAEAGRLEILYDGVWNTVCRKEFGQEEALVACRMLGFNSTAAVAVGSGMFRAGSGPILFSKLQCVGNETSLAQCKHPGLYRYDCYHSEDVGVMCNMRQRRRNFDSCRLPTDILRRGK